MTTFKTLSKLSKHINEKDNLEINIDNVKLHLICENCGCNNMWSWECIPEEIINAYGNKETTDNVDLYIKCDNCVIKHN